MTDGGNGDFEFERRFLLKDVPVDLLDAPALIVQSYFLAQDGFAIRLRVQASATDATLAASTSPLHVLEEHTFDFCALTVKGPTNGGTRYEAEREIDVNVGIEMIRRGGGRIVKTRYSAWLGADGWVIDVFGGANHPLVIAECERSGPVVDLQIPSFCLTEITDDRRFSNDYLSHTPYSGWAASFAAELAVSGPRFRQDFGHNARLPGE
ncbi:CYTH domain-containing protein [Oerskovia enterophila]|uniref:Inorganic triphosphatase n=1 Tax=Oerskovia enterophila TaxID=43678 RepID=A0A163QBC7_9CELL|nr:CYTH domain-containing protein [Oerskovia enterophila]KZM33985.1 inorganic triphosphatase [Oerskovia enterophila]OCI31648.1 inorganic triphosphatase [Oerskovia enterophila]